MSETVPEAPGGNNPLTRKFAGIPGWVILAGVAVLAYLYFKHQSSTSTATATGLKTTGGGGSATTGNVKVQKGAVQITVKQSPDQDQPEPKPPGRHKHHGGGGDGGPDIDFHEISVDQGRELRKKLKAPRIWVGQPGGEKVQLQSGASLQAQKGKLYTTQYNYQHYLSGK